MKRSCEFPLPLCSALSLLPSPAAPERAAGYFSFGKSDTALPTALNFNSSRSDEGRTDGRSRPPSLHPYSTEGERPRALLRLNRNLRNTHVAARLRLRLRLRRAPPFRDRGGKMGRRTLYLVRGRALRSFAHDDRNHAAIICSRRSEKNPRWLSANSQSDIGVVVGNLLLSSFDEQNDVTTWRVIGASERARSGATPFAERRRWLRPPFKRPV